MHVTSLTLGTDALEAVAAELRTRLPDMPIEAADGYSLLDRFPVVVATEAEQTVSVDLTDNILRWRPPSPTFANEFEEGAWIVDLLRDKRTGRHPGELALPFGWAAIEALNAPDPPSVRLMGYPHFGLGPDGLNARISKRVGVERDRFPTAEESLFAILQESGIDATVDDKQASYLSALELFGGLKQAAEAFSGQQGCLLNFLRKGPQSLDQIKSSLKLGEGNLPELRPSADWERLLNRMSPVAKRIAQQRFDNYWRGENPANANVQALLDHWVNRGIVLRRWLTSCPECHLPVKGLEQIDLRNPIRCLACGARLELPSSVRLGFELNPLLSHVMGQGIDREQESVPTEGQATEAETARGEAIDPGQGIVPVVLTGRFLNELTSRGFLWVPGVNWKWNGKTGNIDVLASCDNHLVFAECKDLIETGQGSPTWDGVFDQFKQLVEVARHAKADLVVLAVRAAAFPPGWKERIDPLLGNSLRALLLTSKDLEHGNRYDESGRLRGSRLLLSEIMSCGPGAVFANTEFEALANQLADAVEAGREAVPGILSHLPVSREEIYQDDHSP